MTWPVAGSDRATWCAARLAVCLAVLACASGCASLRHAPRQESVGSGSLASYIQRVRALSVPPAPGLTAVVQTVESWDSSLSAALGELAVAPAARQHRKVAYEYRRLGVLDKAYAHFKAATDLDSQDAAAFDGLARVWRDWGLPHLGLDDAYRAVALAPMSAPAASTLGTLLQAQGHTRDASRWYERALALDPGAAYALNNLCYASIVLRQERALGTCQQAVALAPQLRDAGNNLALAYAASGNFTRARSELARAGDPAAAQYNAGILYLADRQFGKAVAAFDAALQINPHSDRALARARQARAGAALEE